MIRLLMIADDFTGALDTGVQFAAKGAGTRVVTGPEADLGGFGEDVQVLVVDAETRHLPAQEAGCIVEGLVEWAAALGVPFLYKKTDSALRGNVGAELAALLRASGEERLAFLPAFPQIGRCTVGGIHCIDGVPVAESVFGTDPFEPVRHSGVAQLIAEQSSVPVTCHPALKADDAVPRSRGIQVFDAECLEDLETTGERLMGADALHVMAGCAGFAAVLPELLGLEGGPAETPPPLSPRLLVVCGSMNPITLAQMDAAEWQGFTRLRLTAEQKLEPDHWRTPRGQAEFAAIRALLEENPRCIIDANEAERGQTAAGCGARLGVARAVGGLVGALYAEADPGTLLVTGGDTLLQCMNGMGIHKMAPVCELTPGVVLSRFDLGGRKRHIISKSGGFGGPQLLVNLAKRLAEET